MNLFRWYAMTSLTFVVGLILVSSNPDAANTSVATFLEYREIGTPLSTGYGFQIDQSQFFSWWNWEIFVLGFMGYVCFGAVAIALSNPLQSTDHHLQYPNFDRLLLHFMVAGFAGFFTVILESQQEFSALLTGSAFLVLITNFGPDVLRIHQDGQ